MLLTAPGGARPGPNWPGGCGAGRPAVTACRCWVRCRWPRAWAGRSRACSGWSLSAWPVPGRPARWRCRSTRSPERPSRERASTAVSGPPARRRERGLNGWPPLSYPGAGWSRSSSTTAVAVITCSTVITASP